MLSTLTILNQSYRVQNLELSFYDFHKIMSRKFCVIGFLFYENLPFLQKRNDAVVKHCLATFVNLSFFNR